MITTSSKMEGMKPSGLMETVDIMDLIPCVGSVHCITQDLALSGNLGKLPFHRDICSSTNVTTVISMLSTPPTRHAEESKDSDTLGARSTPSNFTAPLSPDHPLTHASPTLVPFLRRTARMVVRVLLAISPSLSARIAEVAAMSDSAFRKRFRSSYESSPSSSPPDLPSRKRYRSTSELVKDDEEEDNEDEDEEVEESSESDSKSEDAEDKGPIVEDKGPATGDEGLAAGEEGPGLGLMGVETPGDSIEKEGQMPSISEVAPSIVPLPISSPMISLTVPSLVAPPAMTEARGFLTKLGAQVEMQGGLIHDHMSGAVRDEIFSQRYRLRSLEHEQERIAVTFRVIWRPILALESWAGQTDAQRAALWHAINDTQMEN
ncbi:hypothetical protein Tco_1167361 [Tanacetum coccineum]